MKTNNLLGMLVLALAFCALNVHAQEPKDGPKRPAMSWEKMQEMQISFMAKSLNLTDKETEKFKEVYKEYSREMRGLMGGMPGQGLPPKNEDGKREWKEPTDGEVEAMLKRRFEQSRKRLDLHEKYYDIYRKFLSPKQIQKIYDMEMMNMGRVQQEINRRNMMRGTSGGNGQPQRGWKPNK